MGFFYLGHGVSLHSCSSKAQLLLLTLDQGCLLTAAVTDFQCGIAPLGPPEPAQPPLLGCSSQPLALSSGMGASTQLPPLALGSGWLLRVTAPGLGHEVTYPNNTCTEVINLSFEPWRREQLLTPVSCPEEFSTWGHKESVTKSDPTQRLSLHFSFESRDVFIFKSRLK